MPAEGTVFLGILILGILGDNHKSDDDDIDDEVVEYDVKLFPTLLGIPNYEKKVRKKTAREIAEERRKKNKRDESKYGTLGEHLGVAALTAWWTGGLGNAIYALYKADKKEVESESSGQDETSPQCPECGESVLETRNENLMCVNCDWYEDQSEPEESTHGPSHTNRETETSPPRYEEVRREQDDDNNQENQGDETYKMEDSEPDWIRKRTHHEGSVEVEGDTETMLKNFKESEDPE